MKFYKILKNDNNEEFLIVKDWNVEAECYVVSIIFDDDDGIGVNFPIIIEHNHEVHEVFNKVDLDFAEQIKASLCAEPDEVELTSDIIDKIVNDGNWNSVESLTEMAELGGKWNKQRNSVVFPTESVGF